MKKKFFAIIALCLISGLIAGCSAGGGNELLPEDTPEPEVTDSPESIYSSSDNGIGIILSFDPDWSFEPIPIITPQPIIGPVFPDESELPVISPEPDEPDVTTEPDVTEEPAPADSD